MTFNRNTVFLAGLVAIVGTIALYLFLTDAPGPVDMWGVAFILAAEAAATVGCVVLPEKKNINHPVVVGSGVTVLALYTVLAIAVSLIFMIFFRRLLLALIFIQAVAAVLAALLVLFIVNAGKSVAKTGAGNMQSRELLRKLAARIQLLMEDTQNALWKEQLRSVYEALFYSDYGEATEYDEKITAEIDALEKLMPEADDQAVTAAVEKLLSLLSQRKIHVAASKQGKI